MAQQARTHVSEEDVDKMARTMLTFMGRALGGDETMGPELDAYLAEVQPLLDADSELRQRVKARMEEIAPVKQKEPKVRSLWGHRRDQEPPADLEAAFDVIRTRAGDELTTFMGEPRSQVTDGQVETAGKFLVQELFPDQSDFPVDVAVRETMSEAFIGWWKFEGSKYPWPDDSIKKAALIKWIEERSGHPFSEWEAFLASRFPDVVPS